MYSIRIIGTVLVATLSTELDSNNSPILQQEILSKTDTNAKVVLDVSGVTFISSAGLRLLVSLYYYGKRRNAVFAIAGASQDLRDTLAMSTFDQFFTFYPDVQTAIASLATEVE